MAWTEQCKIAFKVSALGKLGHYKNKNRKVTDVLRELEQESGIPFGILKTWYYEKETSTNNQNESNENEFPENCLRCGKKELFLTPRSGKPLSKASKYYGLCNTCRSNQRCIKVVDKNTNDNKKGFLTVCPNCEIPHYVDIEQLKIRRNVEQLKSQRRK